MAKRLICFPFVDGSLQEYSFNDLDDDERARVYNGEEVTKRFVFDNNKKEVWKANEEVELTLHYKGYGRGRSAVTFYWVDDNGHNYPMFIKDVDELLKQNMGTSSVHAIFTYVKRGANYGIKFLRTLCNSLDATTRTAGGEEIVCNKFTMELMWHNCLNNPPKEFWNNRLYVTNGEYVHEVEYNKERGWWSKDLGDYIPFSELSHFWWADLEQTVQGGFRLIK